MFTSIQLGTRLSPIRKRTGSLNEVLGNMQGGSKTRITESPKHNTCPKEEVTDGVSCANGCRKVPAATLLPVVVDSVTAHKRPSPSRYVFIK